jgi:hypothetical protein
MALAPLSTHHTMQATGPIRPKRLQARGNLPEEVNTFVGRERELARVRELLSETRLLTLVGPSGVGKTRLALRLEADLRNAFPDGTWIVDLSPVSDAALVPQAVADVPQLARAVGRPTKTSCDPS